jgi:ribonuclease HII
MIVGIDEVGRGCWAGPVVAGAVVLHDKNLIAGLTDSKLLRPRQRQQLSEIIHSQAVGVGMGWVSAAELDNVGLTAAVRLAMQRALQALQALPSLAGAPQQDIVIDGNYNFLADNPLARTLVKADLSVPAVSAASIVAKVARDTWMTEHAAKLYPDYGFEAHVGYGTARHLEALQRYGITPLHRKSFKPLRELC